MSVLVKGIDMPTNCADCKARIATGCCGNLPYNMRMPNCPLVEEPKHGTWVKVTNGRGGHECGVCHNYAPSYENGEEHLSDYCPNCGAKMDGIEGGE